MELGARLKQARLEAGLSQRQLCGETITRNMLSLIENGSAKPSMETLRYLSARLEKPVSFFLEEQTVTSPNQPRIALARQRLEAGAFGDALEALKEWQGEDPVFDPERMYLTALCCIRLAEQALEAGKNGYAAELLERAALAGSRTAYYTRELEQSRLVLYYRAQPEKASALAQLLSGDDGLLLLRAEAAMAEGNPFRCGQLLDAAQGREDPRWQLLRGEAYFRQGDYKSALPRYRLAEEAYPVKAVQAMEACCRELEDYKMAYHYACKLRLLREK